MTAAQFHRGPDDSGLVQDSKAVLGHRRLSIIDLSPDGRQPMSNENDTVWVTFNGEIYNFPELVSELSDHQFRSHSDTEVLVHGYEEWGIEGLLGRLRGMFSFAIYDSRSEEPRCLLARDRLGIKPLYYVWREPLLAFASEVKALVASGLVANQKDANAITGLLLLGSVPAPATDVRGVRCLMPGHYLVSGHGGIAVHKYWDSEVQDPAGPGELRETLRDSVERHLVSDVPLGVFLSGGVDSAALVALATRAKFSLATLTVVFDEKDFSEGIEARKIAQSFGTDHREVRVTGREFMDAVPKIVNVMDQPTNDGVNTYFVSRAAQRAGLTVVLSGLGGDEVFGGYKHYHWLARHGNAIRRFSALPGFVRRTVVGTAVRYGQMRGRENWMRLSSLRDRVSDEGLYLTFRGFFAPQQVQGLLDVDAREVQMVAEEYLNAFRPVSANGIGSGPVFRHFEMQRYLHDQLLRDTDVFSMAHSIEVRVPFLDHKVVECASKLSQPEANGHGNKPLLTEAVGHPVVFEAARRSKRGFAFPFGKWMRAHSPELREMALAGGYLNHRTIGQLWNEFDHGRLHWSRAWMLAVIGAGK
jgi:asparagine synthase (glutamine-hydrolysing)